MDTLKYRKFEEQLEKFSNIDFSFFASIFPPHVLCFSCVHQCAFLNFCSERSTSIGKWTGSSDELGWPLLRRGLQLNVEPWMGSVALLSGAFYFKCVTVSCAGAFHYFCRFVYTAGNKTDRQIPAVSQWTTYRKINEMKMWSVAINIHHAGRDAKGGERICGRDLTECCDTSAFMFRWEGENFPSWWFWTQLIMPTGQLQRLSAV